MPNSSLSLTIFSPCPILKTQAVAAAEYIGKEDIYMGKLPENIDYEIAKIWFSNQDLSNTSPEDAKKIFFDAFHRIEKTNVERWD